jgi:HAMP domain-containing protein
MLAQSSNALNINLENLGQRIEEVRLQIQTAMNNPNNNAQTEIQQLRQELADLAREVHRRS